MGKNQQGKKKDGRFCQASHYKPIKRLELRAKLNPRDAVSAIEKHPRILFSASLLPRIFIQTLSFDRRILRLPQLRPLSVHRFVAPQIFLAPSAKVNFANTANMRPLTEGESKTVFEKLANYTGKSLTNLLTDTAPGKDGKASRFVFRVQESRVYYVREDMANLATSVARDNLLCLGNCIGKLTKTGKFRLHITALDIIAPHARAKIWVKPNGEMPFLYGGHIVKAHVGRWSEDCPEHQGIIVYSMNEYVMHPCTMLP
jgi:60S ribosome subunit biogenesis protein NIP7